MDPELVRRNVRLGLLLFEAVAGLVELALAELPQVCMSSVVSEFD